MRRALPRSTRRTAILACLPLLFSSCRETTRPVTLVEPELGKVSGGGSATVTGADPSSGEQGQVGEVIAITGSGFARGDRASWEIDGSPSGGVVVTSTSYVSSTQLTATIDIAADATVDLYDIAVYTSSGRKKGIGTELFTVKVKVQQEDTRSRALLVWDDELSGISTGIRGDSRDRYGDPVEPRNEYEGDFCGVRSFVWDGNPSYDGTLEFDAGANYTSDMDGSCGSARFMRVFFGTDVSIGTNGTVASPYLRLPALADVGPGGLDQAVEFGMHHVGPNACMLAFDPSYAGASPARVTRLPSVTGTDVLGNTVEMARWRVESQGNHVAACVAQNEKNGKWVDTKVRYYLPFAVTITAVPYPYPRFP